jgi:beta-lactamase class A
MDLCQGFTRRASLAALAVVALIPIGGCSSDDDDSTEGPSETSAPSSTPADVSADEEFEELEDTYDVRLGVYTVDTGTDHEIEYRADERPLGAEAPLHLGERTTLA